MSPRDLVAAFSRFSRPARRQAGQARHARQRRIARPATRAPHLAAELLESRCMLSITATLENNISMFDRIHVNHPSMRLPANPGGRFVGQFFWNGPGFKSSFCVEIGRSISPGLHTFSTRAPLASSGLANAGLVADFWRSYGPTTLSGFTSVTDAAAFQLGIWELISDGTSRDLKSGSFQVGSSASPAVARAASWLTGTGTPAPSAGGPAVSLYVLQHPTKQDQVVWEPAPSINIETTDGEADEVMTARDNPNTGRFRLSRSGDTSQDMLVKVQVSGTATYSAFAADDYTLDLVRTGLTGYFVTIPSGRAFVDIVCTPFQDGTNEDTETVTLSIAPYTGYAIGPRGQATVSILDAPVISAASIGYRIDLNARPAARCWPVDGVFRILRNQPQDTLWTGEPYVFSLSAGGTERTAGVTWELVYNLAYLDADELVRVTTGAGTSFPHTFTLDDELRPFNAGWYVRFFVDANRNGIADSSESVVTGAFKDVLQDRKSIWLCRLEEEKKVYAGTIYNDVFGVTAFFDELIATVKNVSFGRNNVVTADAIYGFILDRIGVNDAENVDGGIDTIIHESVHALDDARNWLPGARPVFLDRVEGVGYTAAALLKRDNNKYLLKSIRTFESLLMDPGVDEAALRKGWKDCVVQLKYFAGHVDINAAGTPCNGTAADVQAVKEDVGLWFNMTRLMERYQRRLVDRGLEDLTLETTYVSGNDRYAIPNVFLE